MYIYKKKKLLNLGFTFKGTSASEKGDKVHHVDFSTPDKTVPLFDMAFGLGCITIHKYKQKEKKHLLNEINTMLDISYSQTA